MQTDLAKRIDRLLYGSHGGLNLKRPDIDALTGTQAVAVPIDTLREIEDLLIVVRDCGTLGHYSSCALHNGPAFESKPCDCGVDPSMTPEVYGSEFPAKATKD